MKNIQKTGTFVILLLLSIYLSSCHHDKKDDSASLEINQFIWNKMNYAYLWTDSVPNLASYRSNSGGLNDFLNSYSDHEKLFNTLLYPKRDHWSWIVDDYIALEKMFQGISKSKGFDFNLAYTDPSQTNIFGFVNYVVKGSPADLAGLKRGDLFDKVDGQVLNTSNYQSLLSKDAYSISLTSIVIEGKTKVFVSLNKNVPLTAVELHENPIYMDTVFNLQDGNKVGYLMYNQFESNYDLELNTVFQKFKSTGINQLVLDLRYNGGGSVQTAIYLSSMIYSTSTNKIIIKNQYNSYVQADLQKESQDYFTDYFADSIKNEHGKGIAAINSLGLEKLYVITSKGTASASELVINALRAYIPVLTVGDTTVGKYVASATLYDYIDDKGTKNPNHTWALQPIILKIANANGVSDFVNGFNPNIPVSEFSYVDKFTPLGNANEPLLKAALNVIQYLPPTKSASVISFKKVADSKDMKPHAKEMFIKPYKLRHD